MLKQLHLLTPSLNGLIHITRTGEGAWNDVYQKAE